MTMKTESEQLNNSEQTTKTLSFDKVTGKSRIFELILFVLLIFVDQLTKILAVNAFSDGGSYQLIPGVLHFVYVKNTGASFGIFKDGNTMFLILIPILVLIMLFYFFRIPGGKHYLPLRVLGVFLVAGAFGNLADRIRVKHVIDFIYVKLINFPVFNAADCYITVSVFLVVIFYLLLYRKDTFEFFHIRKKSESALSDISDESETEDQDNK